MSKFYRHYKNKPYKILGEARHSETLESMVLYETRYENDLGKIWVRPKTIFFEEIKVNDRKIPRFEKIEFDFNIATQVRAEDKENICVLLDQVFGGYPAEKLESTLQNRQELLLITASLGGRIVGFKLGYTYNKERFYSWLGAVDPEFRGLGIGQELLSKQHQWCRDKGFKLIETRTKNKWREMLLLNIKNGFNIVGTYTNTKGETKIILEKQLK